jgi:hypothetical protein
VNGEPPGSRAATISTGCVPWFVMLAARENTRRWGGMNVPSPVLSAPLSSSAPVSRGRLATGVMSRPAGRPGNRWLADITLPRPTGWYRLASTIRTVTATAARPAATNPQRRRIRCPRFASV